MNNSQMTASVDDLKSDLIPAETSMKKSLFKASSSTGSARWAKVRQATHVLNLQKKTNEMPKGKPVIDPIEISMHNPRY